MADLNPEEIRRLVSGFFSLGDNEAESASLRDEVENSAAAALEVLAQVQAASEGPAPSGLGAEQNQAVGQKVEALIVSLRRKPGLLSFFKRRPASKPKPKAPPAAAPGPAPASKPPAVAAPEPKGASPAPAAIQAPRGETDLEDTAPIADVPAAPQTGAPGSALAAMQAGPPAPSSPPPKPVPEPKASPVPARAEPAPAAKPAPKPAKPSPSPKKAGAGRGALAAALVLVALLGFGLYLYLAKPAGLWSPLAQFLPVSWFRPAPQTPKPVTASSSASRPPQSQAAAPRAPAAIALPAGLALRSDVPAPAREDPLPAELPKTTPMVAGAVSE